MGGKGPADRIGAAIKRNSDHQVVSKKLDITCVKDFVDLLSNTNSKIKLFLVKEEDINQIEAEIPSALLPVPTTMKIYQLVFTKPDHFLHVICPVSAAILPHLRVIVFNLS